jgi:hypothetical protein
VQLLQTKIPKAQKNSQVISIFLGLFGSPSEKAAYKMLVKSTSAISGTLSIPCLHNAYV